MNTFKRLLPSRFKSHILGYLSSILGESLIDFLKASFIVRSKFNYIFQTKCFDDRQILWSHLFEHISNSSLLFLEFGVWEGASVEYISSLNSNLTSHFVGFDSFEGLPSKWLGKNAGYFSTDGKVPQINDDRISFVKGWFQVTLPHFLSNNPYQFDELVVHYDADLYSSTLFCLAQISLVCMPYYAIFDEFTGDECRALYDYSLASGCSVEFLGYTLSSRSRLPNQVICRISPPNANTIS